MLNPRCMSSFQSGVVISFVNKLSMLPAIDLIGANELFNS